MEADENSGLKKTLEKLNEHLTKETFEEAKVSLHTEAQSYSNVIGLLAGFSLTSLVLILGCMVGNKDAGKIFIDGGEKIITLFSLSFAGFIATSFSFAYFSRFGKNNTRQNVIYLFLAHSTSASIIFLISGVISLVLAVAMPDVLEISIFIRLIALFPIIMLPATFTLCPETTTWKPIKYNNERKVEEKRILMFLTFIPILLLLVHAGPITLFVRKAVNIFAFAVTFLFLLITYENYKAISFVKEPEDYQITFLEAAVLAGIHSTLYGLLLLGIF